MPPSLILEMGDLNATMAFGRQLGALLFPNSLVSLIGPLGAGKTHLVRAIAEGLQIADSRMVTSPTFVLIQEYHARLPIYHFDAYRLQSANDFLDLGAQEYFEGNGVCLVEWADRVAAFMPKEQLQIAIEVKSAEGRRFELTAYGVKHSELLRCVA